VSGFHYLLALENGEPADPAAVVTVARDWRPRMTVVASNGQLFLIIATEQAQPSREAMGLLVVEPVGEPLA
jgi:hypothetical protein